MAYCPRCGVEVEDRLEACPLCDTPIPPEVRTNPSEGGDYPADVIPPKPMYRPLTKRQRRALFRGALAFLALFPVALTMMLDLSGTGSITWSYYVAVPVVTAAVISWVFYRFGKRPLVSVTATLVAAIVAFVLISMGMSADWTPILPYFVIVFLAAEGLVLYVVTRRRDAPGIISFAAADIAVLAGALNLLLRRGGEAGDSPAGGWWSLIVAAVMVPIVLYTVYLRRVRRKGLNLGGFFFLDLALMMVGIDLAVSGGVGWSVVTALIFVPVSAILYVLHVVFFNDTDWRKALHL
jgi:hypothetical protein